MTKPVSIFFYLLTSALLILVFYGFWHSPITLYDEAVYANNALEMSQGGHPFILTLDYNPNLYNTKPPLAIWLMAISIKIFGANEFAVRSPSVLAFIILIIALTRFSKQYFASIIPGIISAIVLLGSQGLMFTHGARTGDLDMLFILFSTLFVVNVARLLVSDAAETNKHFIWSGVFFLAAYFTKSTAIFLFIPGLLIGLLMSKNRQSIITSNAFFIIPLVCVLIIAGYYWLMDTLVPGYTSQVLFSEYKRAYADIMPWHRQPFGWYFDNLFNGRFTPYAYLVLPAIVTGCIICKGIAKKVFILFSIVSLTYLLFISIVPDKLEWYDLPAYPLFALLIGVTLYELLKRISQKFAPAIAIGCCCMAAIPVYYCYKKITGNKEIYEAGKIVYCLQEILKTRPPQRFIVLYDDNDPLHYLHLDFYRKAYQNSANIRIINDPITIEKNDTLIYTDPAFNTSLSWRYHPDTIAICKYGVMVVVK